MFNVIAMQYKTKKVIESIKYYYELKQVIDHYRKYKKIYKTDINMLKDLMINKFKK